MLRGLLAGGEADGFLGALHAEGLIPDEARALRLFGRETPRGESETFTAEREAIAIAAAPGGRVVEGDWPASPLLLEVRRAIPRRPEEAELPPPLAEPRLDFRVDRATAAAYEVAAGEYIQIIDVEGKQCSDFLAFNRGKLERGVERGLDATTTRTLMGAAYPQPGLYRKSFDVDMDPLVEVVQDTVGRHDSFALACTAKYYEDLGYPGHVNCSQNFNGQVTPFGVAPRRAGRRSTSSTTPTSTTATTSSPTSPGRGRGTMSCCGPPTTCSAPPRHAPTTSTPPTAGRSPTSTSASTARRTASRWRSPIASPRRLNP